MTKTAREQHTGGLFFHASCVATASTKQVELFTVYLSIYLSVYPFIRLSVYHYV